MKLRTCAVLLLSLLVLSSQVMAFNGQRKGFILGGGLGAGWLNYQEPGLEFNKFAPAGNFKIGYAPSNSLEIYFTDNVHQFNYGGLSFAVGLGGVGLTKYLNPEGTGFFVFGGAGIGLFMVLESGGGSENGLGLIGGIGFDIAKHWNIQADVLYTSIASGAIKSLSVRATINFLAF
jgi:hypothetical protein